MIIPNKLHHEIIPGILEQDWEHIEKKIELVKPFAKTMHIDLLDGVFAPNKTFFDPTPFKKYATDVCLELHMMVDNPLQYLKPWADMGFQRFIGQIEKMPDIAEFVAQGQLLGEVGLALDTPTPVEKISVNLDDLDFVFVMTVKAGFSRQSFLPEMLEKVKALRAKSPFIPIEVDGGVSAETITQAKDAGATRFVSTGFLFGAHPQEQYHKLCQLVV
jgi:ribulose-phosphate 3-epimerase